jgi:hypothetical protein
MINIQNYIIEHNVPYIVISDKTVILFETEETWSEYELNETEVRDFTVTLIAQGYHPFTLNPSTTMYTKNE